MSRKMGSNLTSSLMGNMRKESSDLTLRILLWTNPAKLRKRVESLKKPRPWVEVLPFTTRISLINYPIEELLCHDICNRDIVGTWGRIAGTLLAPGATVVVACATVPPSAAAKVCGTATVLTHHPSRQCSSQNSGKEDSQWEVPQGEGCHFGRI